MKNWCESSSLFLDFLTTVCNERWKEKMAKEVIYFFGYDCWMHRIEEETFAIELKLGWFDVMVDHNNKFSSLIACHCIEWDNPQCDCETMWQYNNFRSNGRNSRIQYQMSLCQWLSTPFSSLIWFGECVPVSYINSNHFCCACNIDDSCHNLPLPLPSPKQIHSIGEWNSFIKDMKMQANHEYYGFVINMNNNWHRSTSNWIELLTRIRINSFVFGWRLIEEPISCWHSIQGSILPSQFRSRRKIYGFESRERTRKVVPLSSTLCHIHLEYVPCPHRHLRSMPMSMAAECVQVINCRGFVSLYFQIPHRKY